MKPLIAIVSAVLFAVTAGRMQAQTLNWGSAAFSDLVDSEGNDLDNSYVFELGAFGSGFDPTAANVNDWFTNWRVFDTANFNAGNGLFTGTAELSEVSNYQGMFEGLSAYIWVRNANTPGPNSEWFLGRKTSGVNAWVFPDLDPGCCPNGEVTQWSLTSLGNEVPVWGNQTGHLGGGDYTVTGGYDLQTHVVPEPASCLLISVAAGVCFLRRRRVVEPNA